MTCQRELLGWTRASVTQALKSAIWKVIIISCLVFWCFAIENLRMFCEICLFCIFENVLLLRTATRICEFFFWQMFAPPGLWGEGRWSEDATKEIHRDWWEKILIQMMMMLEIIMTTMMICNYDDDDGDDDDEPGQSHWVWQRSKLQQCKTRKICTWQWTKRFDSSSSCWSIDHDKIGNQM